MDEKWISIDEALPESGSEVLILYNKRIVTIGHYSDPFWFRNVFMGTVEVKPTHWMPLPSPPKKPRRGIKYYNPDNALGTASYSFTAKLMGQFGFTKKDTLNGKIFEGLNRAFRAGCFWQRRRDIWHDKTELPKYDRICIICTDFRGVYTYITASYSADEKVFAPCIPLGGEVQPEDVIRWAYIDDFEAFDRIEESIDLNWNCDRFRVAAEKFERKQNNESKETEDMRKIKFRGKPVYKNEWVYGSFLTNEFDDPFIKNTEMILVDLETVGEYAGVYDASGKEIYEGDIVKIDGKVYAVVFSDQAFSLATKEQYEMVKKGIHPFLNDYAKLPCISKYTMETPIEIIGDVYGNIELLEQ